MKKRITESQLKNIIVESIKEVLNETFNNSNKDEYIEIIKRTWNLSQNNKEEIIALAQQYQQLFKLGYKYGRMHAESDGFFGDETEDFLFDVKEKGLKSPKGWEPLDVYYLYQDIPNDDYFN